MDDYYTQVLEAQVEPAFVYMNALYDNPKLMEDGNRAHGLKNPAMQRWKKARGIVTLDDWPPCSPDFNPIEKVWRIIKQRLKHRAHTITTIAELKAAVQEEWDRLDPSEWDRYIDEMGARLREGKQRQGLATSY